MKRLLRNLWHQLRYYKGSLLARALDPTGTRTHFICNACGRACEVPTSRMTREEITCRCGSTVRQRALIHVLSTALFGRSLAIPNMPCRKDIVGIDMSASDTYALGLAGKLGYTNTFLHQPPQLDITAPTAEWLGICDFVISSDVFEHVEPPVARAFANTYCLLKPGGLFILTVPYTKDAKTVEHFPELHEYRVEIHDGKRVLINTTRDGAQQTFEQIVFHGGKGLTLEMRLFSESGVIGELRNAGFTDIRIQGAPFPKFGILWPNDWSLPISARRPSEGAPT
jgi:SAM-dependent methyltransferase